jgi:hypothetical protein
MGLQIASLVPGLEQAGQLAFADGTGRSLETWETYIKDRRKKLGLPGDPERPFQWSLQDFYVIAALKLSNIVFAHTGPADSVVIDRWIRPPSSGTAKLTNPMFIILWGPQQLIVTKGKIYMFTSKDLPGEFMATLDGTTPIPEADARGYLAENAAAGHAIIELPEESAAAAAVIPLPAPKESEFNFAEAPPPRSAAVQAPRAAEFNFAEAPPPRSAAVQAPRSSEFNFAEEAAPAAAAAAAAGPPHESEPAAAAVIPEGAGVTESKGDN